MESIGGYASDEDSPGKETTTQSGCQSRDQPELDNYDNIQMDMSEDSNSNGGSRGSCGVGKLRDDRQLDRTAGDKLSDNRRQDARQSEGRMQDRDCRVSVEDNERKPSEARPPRDQSSREKRRSSVEKNRDGRRNEVELPRKPEHKHSRRRSKSAEKDRRKEGSRRSPSTGRSHASPTNRDKQLLSPRRDEKRKNGAARSDEPKHSRSPLRSDKRKSLTPPRHDAKRRCGSPRRDIKKRGGSPRKDEKRQSESLGRRDDKKHGSSPLSRDEKKRSSSPRRVDKKRSDSPRREEKKRSDSPSRRDDKKRSNSPGRRDDTKRNDSPRREERKRSGSPRKRSGSPRREESRRAKRTPDRFYRGGRQGGGRFEKKPSKISILERLGISVPGVTEFPLGVPGPTPAQRAQALAAAVAGQGSAQGANTALPSYYNPGAMNPARYAEQINKRRLLWGNKTEVKPEAAAAAAAAAAAPAVAGANNWEATTFRGDQEGKMTAKFKRLMGIKEAGEAAAAAAAAAEGAAPVPAGDEILRKQEEMFQSMEMQYEVARVATHTHRGLGLGFGAFQYPR